MLALVACSGDDDPETEEPTEEPPSAQDRLDQAQGVLSEAGSVSLTLDGADIPDGLEGAVIRADGVGSMDPPSFDGVITARIAGIQADVPTVAIEDDLYVRLPFTPSHVRTTAAALNVPDPARLFDRELGVVSLLGATVDAEFGDQIRARDEILLQVTGTLPGQVVTDLLWVGDREADFDVTYGLVEDDWEVRTVLLSGPFFPPATSSYTLTLDDYGEPVEITAP